MNNKLFLTLVALMVILISAAAIGIYHASKPFKTLTLETAVKVENRIGINLDKDKLYFGAVPPGAKGARYINLTSDKEGYVAITKEGAMADWLYPDKNGFLIADDVAEHVLFVVNPPAGTPAGNYTGTLTFRFYRPWMASFLGEKA